MTDILTDVLPELPAAVSKEIATGARLFLETPFSEYTVTEGFLLLFFLGAFLCLIIWFFKGGF